MAARLNPRHQDFVRAKIQASQLINVLQDHVLGKRELSQSQIKAADVLLRKSLPDLSQVAMTGEDGGPVQTIQRIELVPLDGNSKD